MPLRVVVVGDGAARADARVVDEHVDAAQLLGRQRDRRAHRGVVADVADDAEHRRLHGRGVEVQAGDARAVGRHAPRGVQAEAGAAAGHDRSHAVESGHAGIAGRGPDAAVRVDVGGRAARGSARPRTRARSARGRRRRSTTTGSTKCSCRWSTYSITRSSRLPETATKSNIARCWTSSHSPTPPAWGHTGSAELGREQQDREVLVDAARRARRRSARCRSASACMSCLNMTRFWTCSPVAIRTGLTARRMAAWPRMSSGLVGSSTHLRVVRPSASIQRIAVLDVPALVGVDRDPHVRPARPRGRSASGGRRPRGSRRP